MFVVSYTVVFYVCMYVCVFMTCSTSCCLVTISGMYGMYVCTITVICYSTPCNIFQLVKFPEKTPPPPKKKRRRKRKKERSQPPHHKQLCCFSTKYGTEDTVPNQWDTLQWTKN